MLHSVQIHPQSMVFLVVFKAPHCRRGGRRKCNKFFMYIYLRIQYVGEVVNSSGGYSVHTQKINSSPLTLKCQHSAPRGPGDQLKQCGVKEQ